MKINSNEVKIGVTVIAAIIIGVLGFRFMHGVPLFRTSNEISSIFPKVNGLTSGKSIKLNGVDIGSVKNITLEPNHGDSVLVSMNIDMNVNIPVDSRAVIESVDLLGTKGIVIEKGTSGTYVKNGGFVQGYYDEGIMGQFQEKGLTIGDKVVQMANSINDFVRDADKLLDQNMQGNLKKTLESLRITSGEISKVVKNKNADIQSSITHLKGVLANADTLSTKNRTHIDSLITNLEYSSRKLKSLSDRMNNVSGELNQIMKKINNNQGTLGKLVNDPSLYNHLDSLSLHLNNIAKHLDQDPSRYLKYIKIQLF